MIDLTIAKEIKTYRGTSHLRVDTSFPEGTVTKLSGASGAGKTTLLKIIAGLITPESGKIVVSGKTWLDRRAGINLSPQHRRVGFVFQDYALFPTMTVEAHLNYATRDQALIKRLLSIGQMVDYATHKPRHLSGGQQQRLAILRALALRPGILLMDEAFSALDDELRESLVTQLKILLQEFGTTTVIVSHHKEETLGFADRSLKIETENT